MDLFLTSSAEALETHLDWRRVTVRLMLARTLQRLLHWARYGSGPGTLTVNHLSMYRRLTLLQKGPMMTKISW